MTSWNAEQEAFIRAPRTDGRLIGIPGGGKTKSILGRLIYGVDEGLVPAENGFLVVTFSRAACHDFRRKGGEMRPGLFTKDNVRTMHSLAGTIITRTRDEDGVLISLETVIYRATLLLRQQGMGALSRVGFMKNVREIYVDEAQDISETQHDFIQALGEVLGGAPIVVVGDPDQGIYGFQGGDPGYLMRHPGFDIQLRINYRSAPCIVAIANLARPTPGLDDMIPWETGDAGTVRLICKGLRGIAKDLVAMANESLAAGRTIAVIGPVKKSYHSSEAMFMSRIGLQYVMAVLRRAGVPVQIHYTESHCEKDGPAYNDHLYLEKDRVHLFTLHGSKGLEFEDVIFVNFHEYLMGREPSVETYQEHRCLVYVGLTRAKRSLTLVALQGAQIWDGYRAFSHLVEVVGYAPTLGPPVGDNEEKPPRAYSWLHLLRNRRILSEKDIARIEDAFGLGFDCAKNITLGYEHGAIPADINSIKLPEEDELMLLFGLWAENTFYNRYRGVAPPCLLRIEAMIQNQVEVPWELNAAVSKMLARFGLSHGSLVPVSLFRAHAEDMDPALVDHVLGSLKDRGMGDVREVFLSVPSICRWLEVNELQALVDRCRAFLPGHIPIAYMWRMCLFLWQYEVEAGYRWKGKYKKHLAALVPYEEHIARVASSLPDGFVFEIPVAMPGLPIRGSVDAIHYGRREIIELKFSKSFQIKHAVQALGYAMMLTQGDDDGGTPWKTRVLNLRTGKTAYLPVVDERTACAVGSLLAKRIGVV